MMKSNKIARINDIFVSIVIPVLNEEKCLERNIIILIDFLKKNFKYRWEIIIVDSNSIDNTPQIAQNLCDKYSGKVHYVYLKEKGRGRALKKCWLERDADILSYMDVDLSTNLEAFPKLIDLVVDGADIAIGSRLFKTSHIKRQLKREILSRGYNLLIKLMFQNRFSDAQCGFKACKRKVIQEILPNVQNNNWFFDTELLLLAERNGYKIAEVPVEWVEDLDSRVKIFQTVIENIKELIRVRFNDRIFRKK